MIRAIQRCGTSGTLRALQLLAAFSIYFLLTAPLSAQTFGCSPAMSNDIVCENSKPGTPETTWQVSVDGDSTIRGFATDISVNRGQTINFKINTDATNYQIDLYRLGYYGGNGARYISSISPAVPLPHEPE